MVQKLFQSEPDPVEERLLELFDFLLSDHGFAYTKTDLGNAVDRNGKFSFCGPLNGYQFYYGKFCINILHLVQRDDYNVYITDRQSTDQVYLLNSTEIPSRLAYDLPALAEEIKDAIAHRELFGHPI